MSNRWTVGAAVLLAALLAPGPGRAEAAGPCATSTLESPTDVFSGPDIAGRALMLLQAPEGTSVQVDEVTLATSYGAPEPRMRVFRLQPDPDLLAGDVGSTSPFAGGYVLPSAVATSPEFEDCIRGLGGPADSLPGVPVLVGTTVGPSRATITWAPPADTSLGTVTGYEVSRDGTDTSGGAFSTTLGPSARTFTFTLLAARPYVLTVTAISAGGRGQGVSATVTPEPPPPPADVCAGSAEVFGDDDGILYEAAINCLHRHGLIRGYNTDEFRPNELLLRQHAATMLVNFVEQTRDADLPVVASGFTDISGNVHATNIEKGFTADIINGFDDGTFRPAALVSREQFVTLLVQSTEGLLGRALAKDLTDQFPDDDGSVHESNIEKAHDAGILDGIPISVEGGQFLTKANVTRGEAAHMIGNALTKVLAPARVFSP